MAKNPGEEEFLEDDEHDEIARRSIFSAGWFRALLVLTVLAIVVVVSLPYLLNWLEPTSTPPAKTQAKSSAPAPSAKAEEAKPKPAPAAPAPPTPSSAERPIGAAPLPVVPAPAPPAVERGPVAKAAPAAKPTPATRPAPAGQAAPAARAEAPTPKSAPAAKRSGAAENGSPGGYWVQVGAFLEERNAGALAKQLRGQNFPVQVSAVTRGGAPVPAPAETSGGQNQLFITGSTPDTVNAALKGKGTAQAVKGGVQVNPPFDLETAMSLSSSLKKEGFKVEIRRSKGAAAPRTTAGGGTTYHVVRVGGYLDRTKAQQARGELEAKGHPGCFLTQGAAR